MSRSTRLAESVGVLVAIAAVAMLPGGRAEAAQQRALTVEVVGEGRVSSKDRRIVCTGRCSVAYPSGRIVELRASAAGDFAFDRWQGGCVGVAPSCLIASDRPPAVRAVFARRPASIQLVVGGPGDVTSEPPGVSCGVSSQDCEGEFGLGAPIQLVATAAPGAVFESWGDGCQRTSPTSCLLVVRDGNEVAPNFRRVPTPATSQTLQIDNPGTARVTSDPPPIDCPFVCSASFEPRTPVRLNGVGVTRWGGGCVGEGNACNLVVDAPTVVTIESPPIGPQPPPPPPPPPGSRRYGINVSVSGQGVVTAGRDIRCGAGTSGARDCQGLFPLRARVILKAVAGPNSRFGGWGGFCTGKTLTCPVRVTAAKTVMAVFRPRRGRL